MRKDGYFMKKLFDENTTALFSALLTLKSEEEYEQFFQDALTVKEILDISQRFQVARLLREGGVYADIAKATGASTATISRVSKCLNYGAGGYSLVLDRMEEDK